MKDDDSEAATPMIGSESGYVVRSEGVNSTRMREIARRALSDPEKVSAEDIRKLAAAILAHQKPGRFG